MRALARTAETVAIAAETNGPAQVQSTIAPEPVPDQAPVAKKPPTSALDKKRDKQLADEGAKVLAAQQSVRITSEKLDHSAESHKPGAAAGGACLSEYLQR